MSRSHLASLVLSVAFISVVSAAVDVLATNNLPNPYRPIQNWAQLPSGVQWGGQFCLQARFQAG
jgi:hypothetical protein